MGALLVIGAGPGIGLSVARRFAREGMSVGLLARRQETLDGLRAGLEPTGVEVHTYRADAADGPALREALDRALAELGDPAVVVYNAATIRADGLGELDGPRLLDTWAVNVVGAVITIDRVAAAMARRGGGTFVVTGGMPEPKASHVSLSLGKAGVRALVAMAAQRYGPDGVHSATVTVAGAVAPGTDFDPDDIAEHYWRLHRQAPDRWETEVIHTGRDAT